MSGLVPLSYKHVDKRSLQGWTTSHAKTFIPHVGPPGPLHSHPPYKLHVSHIDKALESMFLLAFFGFLCCSEFTAPSYTFNPSCHTTLSNISFHSPDTLIYYLKCSKTNQSGQPQPIYLFRLDSYISPYEPIHEYTNTRLANRASPQDPLFITETGRVATRS